MAWVHRLYGEISCLPLLESFGNLPLLSHGESPKQKEDYDVIPAKLSTLLLDVSLHFDKALAASTVAAQMSKVVNPLSNCCSLPEVFQRLCNRLQAVLSEIE